MGDAEPEGGSGRQDPGTTIYKSKFKIAPQMYSGKKKLYSPKFLSRTGLKVVGTTTSTTEHLQSCGVEVGPLKDSLSYP